MAHVHAFSFIGGGPELVVPDNLKVGVAMPHPYEPGINKAYEVNFLQDVLRFMRKPVPLLRTAQ